MNPARPELNGQREVELRCRRHLHGVLIRDSDGTPIGLRVRCTDYKCCPKTDGVVWLHTFALTAGFNGKEVGEYRTDEAPYRPAGELIAALEAHRR